MATFLSTEEHSLNALLKQEEDNKLAKEYRVYSGTKISQIFKANRFTNVGGPCLKIQYTYSGNLTLSEVKSCDTWTQTMEDNSVGADPTEFANSLSTSFDGVNDYATAGAELPYGPANAFTVSMWIKPQNVAAQRCFVSNAESGGSIRGWFLYHLSGGTGIRLQIRATNNTIHDFTDITITAGIWQHVVFTFSGNSNINGASFYKNGTKSLVTPSSQPITGTWIGSGYPFVVGARNSTFNFSGNVDEVTVWDKALSDTEVAELYNSGVPSNPTTHSAASNLQNHYRMGDSDTFPTISDNQGSLDLTMVNMDSGDFEEDVPA